MPLSLPDAGKINPCHPMFELIEAAYGVFECNTPADLDVCTQKCCMEAEVAADFFRHQIRDLPFDYLRQWHSAAYSSEGVTKDIWTYLLPRTLESLASGKEPNSLGLELSLRRFDTGNPREWSGAQWSVLDSFQRTFLAGGFIAENVWGDHQNLDDVLCMFRLGGWTLEPLFDQIMSMPLEGIATRLHRDWCCETFGSIWQSAFWEKSDKQIVHQFYTSTTLRERMESLALSSDHPPELTDRAAAVFDVMDTAG